MGLPITRPGVSGAGGPPPPQGITPISVQLWMQMFGIYNRNMDNHSEAVEKYEAISSRLSKITSLRSIHVEVTPGSPGSGNSPATPPSYGLRPGIPDADIVKIVRELKEASSALRALAADLPDGSTLKKGMEGLLEKLKSVDNIDLSDLPSGIKSRLAEFLAPPEIQTLVDGAVSLTSTVNAQENTKMQATVSKWTQFNDMLTKILDNMSKQIVKTVNR